MDDKRYVIVRYAMDELPRIMKSYGTVTLEQAQEICSDPMTSSLTRNRVAKKPIRKMHKHEWFLGYTKA